MLLTALLANVSILFVARDEVSEAALTDVQEALMSLLAPLGWDNPYIPYVPIGIIQSRPGFVHCACAEISLRWYIVHEHALVIVGIVALRVDKVPWIAWLHGDGVFTRPTPPQRSDICTRPG